MTAREAISAATRRLAEVSDTARLDAELLMAHALGVERDALILGHLHDPAPTGFEALVERRMQHEPVAYITGWRDFWTIRLSVGPGVLIPRPDSEVLIEAAAGHFGKEAPKRILDLGTGPGTLLLAALAQWPDAHGLGIDQSERALGYAEMNALDLSMEDRARFQPGDWATGLQGQFDLILCNPPYVETDAALAPGIRNHEPHDALFAGPDGLDDYRRIAPQIPGLLAPDGCAAIEIGYRQAESAGALLAAQGLSVAVHKDLGGRDRCLLLTLPSWGNLRRSIGFFHVR